MAVIITDMDMPKSCEECDQWSFDYNDEPRCDITYSYISRFDKRLDDCPLKSMDDVAPVIHAKWEDGFCTNCHCDVPAYIIDWKWVKDMDAKYCPNCGAKMDKE